MADNSLTPFEGEPSAVTEDPFVQEHTSLVWSTTWWWLLAHISISVVALVANFIFLLTVVYNRKRHELKTFVSAVIITISVLDILDVARVIPVLVEWFFEQRIFRHVYCSSGIFHELAVAVFLVAISIAVCVQAGKETKYYTSKKASLAHKILIPVVLLLAAGASAPFFLLPYSSLSHSCTAAIKAADILENEESTFHENLFSTLVAVFTYALPVVVIPLALPIAMMRTCISRHCCVARFKQPIGEIIMILFMAVVYFVTLAGVFLPDIHEKVKIDKMMDQLRIPLLWELSNNAIRPLIYFLTNPAVWDGLRALCCKKKHRLVDDEDEEEIEVPLSPVTTV